MPQITSHESFSDPKQTNANPNIKYCVVLTFRRYFRAQSAPVLCILCFTFFALVHTHTDCGASENKIHTRDAGLRNRSPVPAAHKEAVFVLNFFCAAPGL
jgi:hypothetical protein